MVEYHPDKQLRYDQKWQVLSGEISKAVNDVWADYCSWRHSTEFWNNIKLKNSRLQKGKGKCNAVRHLQYREAWDDAKLGQSFPGIPAIPVKGQASICQTLVCLQLCFKLHEEYNSFATTSRHKVWELQASCWPDLSSSKQQCRSMHLLFTCKWVSHWTQSLSCGLLFLGCSLLFFLQVSNWSSYTAHNH